MRTPMKVPSVSFLLQSFWGRGLKRPLQRSLHGGLKRMAFKSSGFGEVFSVLKAKKAMRGVELSGRDGVFKLFHGACFCSLLDEMLPQRARAKSSSGRGCTRRRCIGQKQWARTAGPAAVCR